MTIIGSILCTTLVDFISQAANLALILGDDRVVTAQLLIQRSRTTVKWRVQYATGEMLPAFRITAIGFDKQVVAEVTSSTECFPMTNALLRSLTAPHVEKLIFEDPRAPTAVVES